MNIFVNILVPVICLLIGYLMGSANISIPLGKMVFKQDPREYGSHNPGATNCGRLWGKKYFLIVFFFDVFKTISPLYICWAILTFVPFNNGLPLLPSASAMYAGNVEGFMIQWPVYWVAVIGALSYYFTLKRTGYVSLASIITSWINAFVTWIWAILLLLKVIPVGTYWQFFVNWGPMLYCNYVYAILMTIISIVLIIRHRTNIGRIKAGTERQITWMKVKSK